MWLLLVLLIFPAGCREAHEPSISAAEAESGTKKSPLRAGQKADCNSEEELQVLDEESWSTKCLEVGLPRNTGSWARGQHAIASWGPPSCTPEPETVEMRVLGMGAKTPSTTQSTINNYQAPRGAGGIYLDGTLHVSGGEGCVYGTRAGFHVVVYEGGADDTHSDRLGFTTYDNLAWPVMFERNGHVVLTGGFVFRWGELDLYTAPGLQFEENKLCWELNPDGPKEGERAHLCGTNTDHVGKAYKQGIGFLRHASEAPDTPSFGRELTFTYDQDDDRLIILGALSPSEWVSSELDEEDLYWELDEHAWAIPWKGEPTPLPDPPVIGDGVTLLYHPTEKRPILLDPYGEKSWILAADDSAWEVWREHDPLERPKGDDIPTAPFESKYRFTQWWAPYFAYWDTVRKAAVVIQYDRPHSLCLPVKGLQGQYACPKAHP